MTVIKTSAMKKHRKKIKTFPHPVDSGWSWIVLIATVTIFITFGGILRSFGIYMVEFLTVYNTDSTSSSLLIGLQFASSAVGALFGMSVGFNFFSPRQMIMFGGLIGSIGLMINSFAKSIYFFIFSHSILVGFAIGIINGPCLFSLGKYFDNRRSLANGVTMSGVSFGGLIMGPLSRYLIDTYGLQGAFLIIGAIHLHIILAGALIRPDTFYQVVIKRGKRKISDTKSPQIRQAEQRTRKISDHKKPESKSLLEDNFESLDSFRPRSPTGDSFSPLARKAMFQRMRSRTESEVATVDFDPSLLGESSAVSNSHGDLPSKLVNQKTKKQHYISNEFLFDIKAAEIFRSLSDEKIQKDSNSVKSSTSEVAKNNVKSIFQIICDCRIFKNVRFTIFLISYLFGSIGCFYPVVFLPVLADYNGISKTQQSLLISITSAVDIFGRSFSGLIADKGIISRKQIMIIVLIVCGIINCLNSFYTEFWSLAVFAVIYGLIGGTLFAINTSTLSEIIEGERFGQAIGLMTGGQQLTLGISGPLSGALRDITGTYRTTFYFLGASNMMAAFLLSIDIMYFHVKRSTDTSNKDTAMEMS